MNTVGVVLALRPGLVVLQGAPVLIGQGGQQGKTADHQ